MSSSFSAAYTNRHIVISGGGGYIGAAVVAALLDTPCTITVLDRQAQPSWLSQPATARVEWQESDVSEDAAWADVVRPADIVFHLAAIEAPYSPATIEHDWAVNAKSAVCLAEACRAAKVAPHIVLASSANIYGEVSSLPVNEEMPDNPGRIWSAHKLAAEQYLKVLGEQYGIPVTILRLANVYGPAVAPGSDQHIVINKVIRAALAGQPLTLFANAPCVRDYLYSADAVAAFLAAGRHTPVAFTRYVVGSGEAITIEDAWHRIVEVAYKLTGTQTTIDTDLTRVLDKAEYRHFVADARRFTTTTGWRATTSLSTGLVDTAAWLLNKEAKTGMMQGYAQAHQEKSE